MKRKFKSSTIIPLALLVYLAYMAYYGRGSLLAGNYLHYFGVIIVTLIIIVILHFSLKKKEKLREKMQEPTYGTYEEDESQKVDSDKENQEPTNANENKD